VKFDITPLLTGQVDVWPGYAINEPITAEEKGYAVNLIWPSDYGVNLYADTLFTTEEMIATKPNVVRKVVEATIRGWEAALENPEQAVTYTLEYSDKLTREHETKMMSASIPLVKPDDKPAGYMDRAVWVSMQDLLLKQGFMKQAVDIDKSFTTEFLP
jgi:ABC-type nitrate/sulfonate/bicarbonate transport system substrate-binding protein